MQTQEQIEAYQPLFSHLVNEHGLVLLQSEMDEIIRLSQKVVKDYDKNLPPITPEQIKNHNLTVCARCERTYTKEEMKVGHCFNCGEFGEDW